MHNDKERQNPLSAAQAFRDALAERKRENELKAQRHKAFVDHLMDAVYPLRDIVEAIPAEKDGTKFKTGHTDDEYEQMFYIEHSPKSSNKTLYVRLWVRIAEEDAAQQALASTPDYTYEVDWMHGGDLEEEDVDTMDEALALFGSKLSGLVPDDRLLEVFEALEKSLGPSTTTVTPVVTQQDAKAEIPKIKKIAAPDT